MMYDNGSAASSGDIFLKRVGFQFTIAQMAVIR